MNLCIRDLEQTKWQNIYLSCMCGFEKNVVSDERHMLDVPQEHKARSFSPGCGSWRDKETTEVHGKPATSNA